MSAALQGAPAVQSTILGIPGMNVEAAVSMVLSYDSGIGILPSEFSMIQANPGTYRDAAGILQQGAINTLLQNHLIDGTPLGIMLEDLGRNMLTCFSANPTDLTGFSSIGEGGTFTIVDDTAELASVVAKLQGVALGNVFRITSTTADARLLSDAGTLNTNLHALSVWARVENPGDTITLQLNGQDPVVSTQSLTYVKLELPNTTPLNNGRKFQVKMLLGNQGGRFILPQFEERPTVTSEIVTFGAARDRDAHSMLVAHLTNDEGTIYTEVNVDPASGAIWSSNAGAPDNMDLRLTTAPEAQYFDKVIGFGVVPITFNQDFGASVAWRVGAARTNIDGTVEAIPAWQPPTSPTELTIFRSPVVGLVPAHGHLKAMTIWRKQITSQDQDAFHS